MTTKELIAKIRRVNPERHADPAVPVERVDPEGENSEHLSEKEREEVIEQARREVPELQKEAADSLEEAKRLAGSSRSS
jgi:hypothetical protein